jgi:uncharacterized protein YgiM (DUF1202 family)
MGMVCAISVGLAGSANAQNTVAPAAGTPAENKALREVPAAELATTKRPPEPSKPRATVTEAPQPAAAPQYPFDGVITGSNVNVRSGPGTNYYPVTRLQRNDRVRVLGEEFGWTKIEPPADCYSLIDKQFVDKDEHVDKNGDDTGVVNGDDVIIRAGSDLVNKHYAHQSKLSRGAKVAILGENEAGFYKIKPPAGVALWIHKDYVQPASTVSAATPKRAGITGQPIPQSADAKPQTSQAKSGADAHAGAVDAELHQTLKYLPAGSDRDALAEIEAGIARESKKSPVTQNYTPLATRLDQVAAAAGAEAEASKVYATKRAKQLRDWMALLADLDNLRKIDGEVTASRRPWRVAPAPTPDHERFDAEGELRLSRVFDSKALPQRYRLVDPTQRPARTIAYIEIPRDSDVAIENYLGEHVRVRAASRSKIGTVGRSIPVLVPAEIVIYNPEKSDVKASTNPIEQSTDAADKPTAAAGK